MFYWVSEISVKVNRLTYNGTPETRPHLRKNNWIRSVYFSLAIEADSLSLGQVKDVINNKIVFGEQKEIQEVKNSYKDYEILSAIAPYAYVVVGDGEIIKYEYSAYRISLYIKSSHVRKI